MTNPSAQTAPGRREVQEIWFSRLKHAHTQYCRASEQHRRMIEKLNQKMTSHSDGTFAIASARKAEALAVSEYLQTLLTYRTLVVNGTPPLDKKLED